MISDADEGEITSLVSIDRGYFATASSTGVIKIWEPLKVSPIASITEKNQKIECLTTVVKRSEILLIYVFGCTIKCFSIKNMKFVKLFQAKAQISCLTQNSQQPNIVSFGLASGNVTDLDLRSKSVIRNQKLHGSSPVVAIYSKGFYLISAGKDGKIVIYDYSKMEEVRTLDTS